MKAFLIKFRLVSIALLFLLGLLFTANGGLSLASVLFIFAAIAALNFTIVLDLFVYKVINLKKNTANLMLYASTLLSLGFLLYIWQSEQLKAAHLGAFSIAILSAIVAFLLSHHYFKRSQS